MTYREMETPTGFDGTSTHSILHEHLTVKKFVHVGTHTICQSLKNKARVVWSREMLKNTIAVHRNTSTTS